MKNKTKKLLTIPAAVALAAFTACGNTDLPAEDVQAEVQATVTATAPNAEETDVMEVNEDETVTTTGTEAEETPPEAFNGVIAVVTLPEENRTPAATVPDTAADENEAVILTIPEEERVPIATVPTTAPSENDAVILTMPERERKPIIAVSDITDAAADQFPVDLTMPLESELKLCSDYAAFKEWTGTTADNVFIHHYYGTYGGCEVVVMRNYEVPVTADIKYVTVGERTFMLDSGSDMIYLHKDGTFIDIETAYDNGYLTDDDIAAINGHTEIKSIAADDGEISASPMIVLY